MAEEYVEMFTETGAFGRTVTVTVIDPVYRTDLEQYKLDDQACEEISMHFGITNLSRPEEVVDACRRSFSSGPRIKGLSRAISTKAAGTSYTTPSGSLIPGPPMRSGPPPAPRATATPPPVPPTAPPTPPKGGVTMPAPAVSKPDAAKAPPPKRSCLDCSNFMQKHDVPTRYSKSVGTPMCKKFDKPIGRANYSPDDLRVAAAKIAPTCSGFDKPADDRPATTYKVGFPDITLHDDLSLEAKEACNSCVSCKNFTPSDVVARELGWATGLCSAKGELVPEHRATYVGRKCDIRQFGRNRITTTGINLFPEYGEDFLTPDLIGDFKAAGAYDPLTYETDKPITDGQRKLGIRAWKQIVDKERPDFETGVFMPIYDPEFFDAELRKLIPQTGDDEHPEMYLDHANAVYKTMVLWEELDETPAVWGEAGNGKTELYRHLSWAMQLPFYRISITASTELDDLAGKMHFDKEKGTYFQYGRLPKAWESPGVICLDEPNVGQPDVWQFIRPLTDNSKQLVLDMADGQTISRHASSYMGMAMNPAWDPRNVGAATIGDADGSRLMHIFMPPPPKTVEMEIITKRCEIDGYKIPRPMLNALMKIAEELRGLSEQGAIPVTWGVRPQIKVARATRWFDILSAYKIAVTDFLEPAQAQVVLDVVRANAPAEPKAGNDSPKARRVTEEW